MLKAAIKRRRTKREIMDEKAQQEEEARQSKQKISHYDAMAAEIEAMRAKEKSNQGAADILSQMINAGQLKMNDDGTVTNPHYLVERRRKD